MADGSVGGLVIVFWKIRPEQIYLDDFFHFWGGTAVHDSRLRSEFLSEPQAADQFDFATTIFGVPEDPFYRPFFNVGLWESLAAFDEVIMQTAKTRGKAVLLPFEYEMRERMLLVPVVSRQAGEVTYHR